MDENNIPIPVTYICDVDVHVYECGKNTLSAKRCDLTTNSFEDMLLHLKNDHIWEEYSYIFCKKCENVIMSKCPCMPHREYNFRINPYYTSNMQTCKYCDKSITIFNARHNITHFQAPKILLAEK